MIEFSLVYALAVIFFSALLPGSLLSLGLLKGSGLSSIEKILAGFAFGWVLQGFLPFAEFVFLGIKFSYWLTLLNTALLYALALGFFIWRKGYDITGAGFQEWSKDPLKLAVPAVLLALFIINFWVRIQTLSPIFQELDPYYYMYISQQIITQGFNPLDDQTAWYPLVQVSHRGSVLEFYSAAAWYSIYSQGGAYSNYLLSLIANIYPPLAAALCAFFVYLGLRAWYRQEYALIASAVVSFIPMLLLKLTAGEAEVQPFAFFSLAMFIGFFLWAQKKRDYLFIALAGAAYFTISLGSSTEVVAATIFLLYSVLQSATMFVQKKDLGQFARHTLVFLAFPAFAMLAKSIFLGFPVISYFAANAAAAAFVLVLFYIQKSKIDAETQTYALGALALAGVLILAFTPVGGILRSVALTGLQIAEYNQPLDRTIAEQGTSGAVLEPQLGFIGKLYDHGIYVYIGYLFALPSLAANFIFAAFSSLLNAVLGTNLAYNFKGNSTVMALFFFAALASAFSLYRLFVRKEESIAWFFIALIFPISIVGLIKAKYVIYLGFVLATGLAFIFGEMEALALLIMGPKVSAEGKVNLFYALMALGLILAVFQFTESSAPLMLKSSLAVRFQDNPAALQQKFSDLCNKLRLQGASESELASICAAGKDAIAFANSSINNQYDYQLCYLSLLQNPFSATDDEKTAAAYRCGRISPYWIDSMEWIRYHTENNSRITSWWDYGHWENFFGMRNAVIRNEHASPYMIGRVAHDYIIGTPEELKRDMLYFNSSYALFDSELLLSGTSFGGKYGALNYLACAYDNRTNVSRLPGQSICEAEHLWTQVYVPSSPGPADQCTISFEKKGVIAYQPRASETSGGIAYQLEPRFCMGNATLANGQTINALYDMSARSASGDLKLHRAFVKYEYKDNSRNIMVFTLLYTHDPVWVDSNGTLSDGWEDRTSKFYDSNLYQAFILDSLPGFSKVYTTPDSQVKIYKIKE